MGRAKLTTSEWIAQATKAHSGRYSYPRAEFTGYGQPIQIVCPTHGEFVQGEHNHRNGAGCPRCGSEARARKRMHTFASFMAKAHEVHGGKYSYAPTEIKSNRTQVIITCPEHGEFVQRVMHHLQGQGCRACGYAKNGIGSRLGVSEFFARAATVHKGAYTYAGDYVGMHAPTTISCPLHGAFRQTPSNHLKGAGCPRCIHKSAQEGVLADFLTPYTTVVMHDRTILAPKEIDLWLPQHRIGVEYHGLYWHTEDRVGQVHREKWEAAQAAGIRLIQIFEDEWLDRPEVVKSRLLAAIGQSPRLFGRKTEVRPIETREARAFLDAHHTQGGSACTAAYGAFHNGELVAVATFGKARSGAMTATTSGAWEVYRYASKGTVVGGFSRLLKRFIADFDPQEVVSYCDMRYGTGGLYKAAGFELEGVSPPDYWWVPPGKTQRVPRYQTQKHKLPKHPVLKDFYKPGMTERAVCDAAGWKKIYGVGSQKWVWRA